MSRPILQGEVSERKKIEGKVASGTTAEMLAGLAAATLAILGLVDIFPHYMVSIGVIAAGAALFIEGLSIGSAYSRMVGDGDPVSDTAREVEVGSGFSAQGLGGAAAIVLGILSLIGMMPENLLPIAVMLLGAALLLGGPARTGLALSILSHHGASLHARHSASQVAAGTAGILSLVGIGALVLGILALADVGEWPELTLIALLSVGAAEVLGGSAVLGRSAFAMKH